MAIRKALSSHNFETNVGNISHNVETLLVSNAEDKEYIMDVKLYFKYLKAKETLAQNFSHQIL